MSDLTEQQKQDTVRQYMFQQFADKYKDLTTNLANSPINDQLKPIIMHHFDTAFLWAKEGFLAMQIKPKDPEVIATMTPEELDEAIKLTN